MLTKDQKLQIIADNTTCSEAGDEAGYSMVTKANAEALFDAIHKAIEEDRCKQDDPVAEVTEVTVSHFKLGVQWLPHPEGMVGSKLFLHPPSKLKVWFGPLPESNGKTNWTAIFFQDKGLPFDFANGFTLAQSEYKDRVRYDADCVRHIIGDLADQPDVLAYDSKLMEPYTR